ncbi:MAG: endonuclease MutS2 [Balneolaceae bacterium]|nr:MAG: endonuclease MutS2 [Balneolaceae bacterium]
MSSKLIIYPPTAINKIGYDTILRATLRKCYTPYGREYLERLWASADKNIVQERLACISEWLKLLESSSHPLSAAEDIREDIKECRIAGSALPLESFVAILQNARIARIIKQFFSKQEGNYPHLEQIADYFVNLKPLEDAIQKVVTERGDLRDNASSELKSIRNRINGEKNRLRDTIQRVMKRVVQQGMASDEGPTIRSGRMVIPIQSEFKRKVDGFIHDVSASGQTVYIEPVEALQINNEIRQLEALEQREIDRIIRELTSIVSSHADSLLLNTDQLALMDAIHSRAQIGLDLDGSVPQLSTDMSLQLINARNPNLALKNQKTLDTEPVIPLNLKLDKDELGLIITGPNAGGKSVAMKTAGLLSYMLQCGYPIPVQPDSVLPIINGIFVDVGDDQSIENDLSTFSSRLLWMRNTLSKLMPGSLVLIDEAGAGTDPEEGGALFQAFVEEVIRKNGRVIVTTHHGSLKVFAHSHKNVVNGAMEFNQENLSPTYHFKKGIPGSSYAFEIADRMKLPESLMRQARELLGEKRDSMGDLLISLEKKMQESDEITADYKRRLAEIEKRERTLAEQTSNIENKRKNILEKAFRDAEEILKTANRRIEEAVEKVVMEGREDKEKIRDARKSIDEVKQEIRTGKKEYENEVEEEIVRRNEKPKVGDYVVIGDGNSIGELAEISGNNATVMMNGMRIKSKLNKLVKTNPPKKKEKTYFTRSFTTTGDIDLSVKPRIDLRGMRGDEAINELTVYLDKAIARGLKSAEIIHGKGEGILLKLVHEYLESRKEVESYDIAPWESGGTGCTVVNLK